MSVSKSQNLGIELNGKPVIATPNGIKHGNKGKVTEPGIFLGSIANHAIRRQIRKASRAAGVLFIANARTVPVPVHV